MRSKIILALVLAGSASAQFGALTPTDDGSQLYFIATLPLASELSLNLPNTEAIYRIQAGTITRITVPPPAGFPPNETQGNPQVSGDGTVFSYTDYYPCFQDNCAYKPNLSDSPLSVAGKPYGALTGTAQISSNGRFVFTAEIPGGTMWSGNAFTSSFQLLDLQTGTTVPVSIRMTANGQQTVTNDGRVLGFDPQSGALALWSPQGTHDLVTTEQPWAAIVNAAGTWVVYNSQASSIEWHLRGLSLASGQDVLLARSGLAFSPSISSDGNTVLYVAVPGIGQAAQIFTTHPDGTGNTQLTNLPQAVDSAIIAGLGASAFAVTGSRVVQIAIPSGAVQELIGPTPTCYPGFTALIPGSILSMNGTALTDSTQVAPVPLPTQLSGVRILANGTPLPLVSISPSQIWFQVPFEMALQASVSVDLDNSSVFEGCPAVSVPVVDRQPYFFNSAVLIAAHQDFSGLIGPGSPAQPGEVIHTYATGLGAVTPSMTTGIPTPTSSLFPLAGAFECLIGSTLSGQPLEVNFAGLAPGMIGIYQVDIRMPASTDDLVWIPFNCGTPGNSSQRGGGNVYVGISQ